ncbi:hypothetical protein LUW75_23400 [Streptomyces sp. MRC013]|uniref:hypothetical protein n=1 Tax=Streptomyces sp. MRC013 TaxID=2898276 RepID=UPI002026BACC|nr:hypothetical protein [Streptomyces sp. MRC013]URM92414.1 hypothetical protein LUW75_23400 [Streptomyces sp. MRC013]
MTFAAPAGGPAPEDFRPTHVVPRHGMPAWETPGTARPTVPLDPFLPVRLLERTGDWARVLCSNGWSAWVDGRLLVSVPEDPPATERETARTADPRPLLARAEASLGRYRRAAEDLAAGRTDGEGFRRGTGGLRLGVVVEGEAMWLYDAEHERWLYCDGTRLAEYAAPSAPSASSASSGRPVREPPGREPEPAAPLPEDGAGREPTRVVAPPWEAAPSGGEGGGRGPGAPAGADRWPAPPDSSGGDAAPPGPGHEPTRVVAAGTGPEPTRTVPAAQPGDGTGGPRPSAAPERPAAAEPTRTVDAPGTGRGGTSGDRAGEG